MKYFEETIISGGEISETCLGHTGRISDIYDDSRQL